MFYADYIAVFSILDQNEVNYKNMHILITYRQLQAVFFFIVDEGYWGLYKNLYRFSLLFDKWNKMIRPLMVSFQTSSYNKWI